GIKRRREARLHVTAARGNEGNEHDERDLHTDPHRFESRSDLHFHKWTACIWTTPRPRQSTPRSSRLWPACSATFTAIRRASTRRAGLRAQRWTALATRWRRPSTPPPARSESR